jgi:hypothetical protein
MFLKRIVGAAIGVILVAGGMVTTATPALAAATYHIKTCQSNETPQQTRGFQWCISVMQGDDGNVWIRTEVWDINGENDPYYMDVSDNLYSKTTQSGDVCNGRYPGCSGAGNVSEQVIQSLPNTYENAIQINTAHYSNNEHLCLNHGNGVIHYKFYQGDALNPVFTHTDGNGDGYWSSYPDCTGY